MASVNIPFRLDPEFHKELKQFLLSLGAAKGETQSIQGYALQAVKEKMERDTKDYNITVRVKK